MSGIIGGSGSKSGVIGRTEQFVVPYTARTWTFHGFSGGGNAGGANYAGGYARYGNLVYINGHFSGNSNAQPLYITNLPYTSHSQSNNLHGIAVGASTNNGSAEASGTAYVGANSTTLYFLRNGNWEGWTTSGTKGAVFGGWYIAQIPLEGNTF